MTDYFQYNVGIKSNPFMDAPAPLFSDKETADKMVRAKQLNDDTFWTSMREVFAKDLETLPMERFKVWASTMTVPIMSRNRFTTYMGVALNALDDWNQVDRDAITNALTEPMIGMTEKDYPIYAVFDDFKTTMNRIQAFAHLYLNNISIGELMCMDTIVELGGGVGDMADVIYKLGFKGKYIIYDFPELGKIQKWYHDELGLTNVVHTDKIDDLVDADLCIATWSLTEMPMDLRDQIVDKIGNTKNWLIAYSNEIFGFDNDKYIRENLVPRFKVGYDTEFTDVPYMAWDGGTKYVTIKQNT